MKAPEGNLITDRTLNSFGDRGDRERIGQETINVLHCIFQQDVLLHCEKKGEQNNIH